MLVADHISLSYGGFLKDLFVSSKQEEAQQAAEDQLNAAMSKERADLAEINKIKGEIVTTITKANEISRNSAIQSSIVKSKAQTKADTILYYMIGIGISGLLAIVILKRR